MTMGRHADGLRRKGSASFGPLRVAIYARYSSDNQSQASIEDQVRICRERASREGWTVVDVCADYALTGSKKDRPQIQALLELARSGRIDGVLAESLDRVSRDQEHIAGMHKQLAFAQVPLITLAEGVIDVIDVGFKGTMNALFLKDLAAKTHRGLAGRVENGKSGGGLSYGYDVVRSTDARGEIVRGGRAINAIESAVVQRIFSMYAAGHSPIAVAKKLNDERIPGPEGRAWRDTTIRGHAAQGTGILRNQLYIGELVWNKRHYLRDPNTDNRVSRPNPESEWIRTQVPELRIIDDETWAAVQARLGAVREASGADTPGRVKFWEERRAAHILTGKVLCGVCRGQMSNIGRDYLACAAARKQGVCCNSRSIRRQALETQVVDALRSELMAPELVAEFVSSFTEQWNRAAADGSAERGATARELERAERKLQGLIEAVADGLRGAAIQAQIDALESQCATLSSKLAAPLPAEPRLHPNLAELYREKVETLQEALTAEPDRQEAIEAVRRLIDHVVLTPSSTGKGLDVELVGEIAAMVRLGGDRTEAGLGGAGHDLFERSVKVVAGTGFEPVTFRL